MGIETMTGEVWAMIAAGAGVAGGGLWSFLSWARNQGAALVTWLKPKVEELADGHVSLMKTLKETQLAGTEHLKSINTQLDTHTDILKRIDKQTCQKPSPESNA